MAQTRQCNIAFSMMIEDGGAVMKGEKAAKSLNTRPRMRITFPVVG